MLNLRERDPSEYGADPPRSRGASPIPCDPPSVAVRESAEFAMAPAIDIEPGCANRMNAINVISPYKHHGMWVFDDARVGLVQEPFVAGADTWMDRVVADIPNAEKGFTLIFSSAPFPGHHYRLDWRRAEDGGNWYYSADLEMEGWLCPALFRYFSEAPASLYAQVKARA